MHLLLLLSFLLQSTILVPAAAYASRHRASEIVEINQTINLFAVLVDTSRYDQLDRVFTADASVNFNLPGGSILHGLPEILKLLSGLANVSGQHDITTQYVDLISPNTANATTYFIGNFFGVKAQAGQIFTEYGKLVRRPLIWVCCALTGSEV